MPRVRPLNARSKGRPSCRLRTTSQSSLELSVEIQVTDIAAFVTTSTTAATSDSANLQTPLLATANGPPLLRPTAGYLELIKQVGAQGTSTACGELFTIKQLYFYLTEYIKMRQLWDPSDHLVVYCANDPLEHVFGVQRFTVFEALNLVKKNAVPISTDQLKAKASQKSSQITTITWQQIELLPTVAKTEHTPCAAAACRTPASQIASPLPFPTADAGVPPTAVTPNTQPRAGGVRGRGGAAEEATPSTSFNRADKRWERERERERAREEVSSDDRHGHRRAQKRRKLGDPAPLAGNAIGFRRRPPSGRRRQRSFSILYSSDTDGCRGGGTGGGGGFPWDLRVEVMCDSSDSEVLSIQSKETAFVKDSSDDLWFLDDDDDVAAAAAVTIEIQANEADPPFAEEYEVESEAGDSAGNSDDMLSSSTQDIVVVCNETDIEFWADSESSDTDDASTDDDVHKDKWSCDACDTLTSPLSRYCDRCHELRPHWLPERLPPAGHMRPGTWCSPGSWSPKVAPPGEWSPDGGPLAAAVAPETPHVPWAAPSCSSRQPRAALDLMPARSLLPAVDGGGGCLSAALLREGVERRAPDAGMRRSDTLPLHAALASPPLSQASRNDSPRTCDGSPTSVGSAESDRCATLTRDDSGIGMAVGTTATGTDTTPAPSPASATHMSPHVTTPTARMMPPKTDAPTDLCTVCLSRAKEASLIHGKTGHQVCCYPCAKRLKRRGMRCPVCRKPIEKVIRNYIL